METVHRRTFIILQAVWFALLAASVLFPLFFILSSIPLIVLTALFYIKNIRANLLIMLVILVVTCVAAGGDFIYVGFTVLLLSGVLGALWGLRWRAYLKGAGITSLILTTFLILLFVIFCPASGKNPEQFIADYVSESAGGSGIVFSTDSQFKSLSAIVYSGYKKAGFTPLDRNDDGYDADRLRVFSEVVEEAVMKNVYSVLTAIGAFCGIGIFLLVYLINKRTPSLRLKSFNEFVVNTEPIVFKDMRLNKSYVVYLFLPALIFFLLSRFNILDIPDTIAVAVFGAFACVPCAYSALAFLQYIIGRFSGVSRHLLNGLWWILLCTVVLFPFVTFIVSLAGIVDCFVPLRRVLDNITGRE